MTSIIVLFITGAAPLSSVFLLSYRIFQRAFWYTHYDNRFIFRYQLFCFL